jgi:hypothetical protein
MPPAGRTVLAHVQAFLEAGFQNRPARPKRHQVGRFAETATMSGFHAHRQPRALFERVDCMPHVCASSRSSGSLSRGGERLPVNLVSGCDAATHSRGERITGTGVVRRVAPQRTRGTSMKIAQIAPLMEAVPPKFYGGSERIVAHLCNELSALGHEVTLFGAATAPSPAGSRRYGQRLYGLTPRSPTIWRRT